MSHTVVALFSFLLFVAAFSAESRYDEYLWTKSTWPDYIYRKPRERWRVEDAPLVYQHTERLRTKNCAFISSYGPGSVRRRSADVEEGTADWILSVVDRVVAGATVFGNVCASAVEGGWEALLSMVYEKELLSAERISFVLEDICVETVETVIKKFTLKQELNNDGFREWTLVVRSGDDEKSYPESEAVELACARFLHQRRTQFARALHKAAVEVAETLGQLLTRQLSNARGQKGDERMMQDICEDIHPKCEEWADKGECVVNPSYMLNYCRISCGICEGEATFQKVGSFLLDPQSRQELDKKNADLLEKLKAELCPEEAPADSESQIQQIKYEPLLRKNEVADVSRALYIELKGKCLLLFRGSWSYEICFFTAIRQLRYASDGATVESSNLIGTFMEQNTRSLLPLRLTEAEMEKLGLSGKRRAFIMQTYENGDECEGVERKRSAVVRLMCADGLKQGDISPNTIGVTVEEPEVCRYVVNVFIPWLCHYSNYSLDTNADEESNEKL